MPPGLAYPRLRSYAPTDAATASAGQGTDDAAPPSELPAATEPPPTAPIEQLIGDGKGHYRRIPAPENIGATYVQLRDNRQATSLLQRGSEESLLAGIEQGDPQAIQHGLRRGLLRYSPEQQTEIKRLQTIMDRADRDQTLSPHERARVQWMLDGRMQSIRPQMTPPDQRPVSTDERFSQSVAGFVDPRDGKSYLGAFDRSGRPVLLTTPQDDIEIAAAKAESTARGKVMADEGLAEEGSGGVRRGVRAVSRSTLRDQALRDPAVRGKLLTQARKELREEVDPNIENPLPPTQKAIMERFGQLLEADEMARQMIGARGQKQEPTTVAQPVPGVGVRQYGVDAEGNVIQTDDGGATTSPYRPEAAAEGAASPASETQEQAPPTTATMRKVDADTYQQMTGKPIPPAVAGAITTKYEPMMAEFGDPNWRDLVAMARMTELQIQAAKEPGSGYSPKEIAAADKELAEYHRAMDQYRQDSPQRRAQKIASIAGDKGQGEKGQPPAAITEEEVRALPRGTRFLAPDGTWRVKK